jgi:hypothetical protein
MHSELFKASLNKQTDINWLHLSQDKIQRDGEFFTSVMIINSILKMEFLHTNN